MAETGKDSSCGDDECEKKEDYTTTRCKVQLTWTRHVNGSGVIVTLIPVQHIINMCINMYEWT